MNKISVLDCTLRDGGYINKFNFGFTTIKDIISHLVQSCVEIIECGFLVSGADDKNKTLFPNYLDIQLT
jgi:4-hydroxy 2-oxovalerate aldolase